MYATKDGSTYKRIFADLVNSHGLMVGELGPQKKSTPPLVSIQTNHVTTAAVLKLTM